MNSEFIPEEINSKCTIFMLKAKRPVWLEYIDEGGGQNRK